MCSSDLFGRACCKNMVAATTRVLLPSCDIILPIALMELFRVLLEPALLVTSSLRLVRIIAGSSAVIAGSSGSIVSSVSTIVSVSRSCKPGTLQIHTLAQGMPTPAILACLGQGLDKTSSVVGVRP